MKYSVVTTLALTAFAPTCGAYTVGRVYGPRFVSSPRSRTRATRATNTCGPQGNRCVDQAFKDLEAELNNSRGRGGPQQRGPQQRGRGRGYYMTPFGPTMMGMGPQFQIDEETLRQQREWLNRAFDLAEEVAKSVASSPREAQEADEVIRRSKEFTDKMFGFAAGDQSFRRSGTGNLSAEILRDDKNMFEVAFDVPGVKESDLDVTVEGTKDKVLVVTGKRNIGKDGDGKMQTKTLSKSFPLENESDIDQMSANLENGVLIVSVPRIVTEATETTYKIAVNQPSSEVQDEASATNEKSFTLDLDLPGVLESNIDIEVRGDTEKTLTIKAVREMGMDAEGKPRTKEISKNFQINELVASDKIVAILSNGVLTISAPVDEKKAETSVKKVVVNKGQRVEAENSSVDVEPVADALPTENETSNDENEAAK